MENSIVPFFKKKLAVISLLAVFLFLTLTVILLSTQSRQQTNLASRAALKVRKPTTCPWAYMNFPQGPVIYKLKVFSPNDIYAVGALNSSQKQETQETSIPSEETSKTDLLQPKNSLPTTGSSGVVYHWDGSTWTQLPAPPDPPYTAGWGLHDVDGVATNNIWVGGNSTNASGFIGQILYQWDGTTWTYRDVDRGSFYNSNFWSISVVDTNNVWFAGFVNWLNPFSTPYVAHWDGQTITITVLDIPQGDTSAGLYDIEAFSTGEVMAVGASGGSGNSNPYTVIWNGTTWTRKPVAANFPTTLFSVSGSSFSNIYSVGYQRDAGVNDSYIISWDGTNWTVLPHISWGTDVASSVLFNVKVLSPSEAYAIGTYSSDTLHALIAHYTSSGGWVREDHPTEHLEGGTDIDAINSEDILATANIDYNLFSTMFRKNCTLPPTPTITPLPPTPTASLTPTPAPFTDVPPSSPFYPYIMCLAGRNIISGYTSSPPCTTGTPCFIPGNSITRGQAAKTVVNSWLQANGGTIYIPPSQQTFTDVPNSHPFWLYVEIANYRGFISGYGCGGPGEPCDPQSRPYFRPGNNVTRGQFAKMTVIAKNYQDVIPSGRQTFTDVPPSSPFYIFVERAAVHNIISGYTSSPPCTTGTPCFLTNNSITRGQASKVANLAFFPNNCRVQAGGQ